MIPMLTTIGHGQTWSGGHLTYADSCKWDSATAAALGGTDGIRREIAGHS